MTRFNDELKKIQEYVSLIVEGSIVTNDKWNPTRSDYDIIIIFDELNKEIIQKLENTLKQIDFDDSYFFIPLKKDFFLNPRNNTYDFSSKFKSKTLYGEDLIPNKCLPNNELIYDLYSENLQNLTRRLDQRLINAGFWSEDKTRDVFWKIFKDIFRFLPIMQYYRSGIYPLSRIDTANALNSEILKDVVSTLDNIDNEKKENIIIIAKKLSDYLKEIDYIR